MAREEVSLAAIMFTDIVGYTALSERDEALALKLLDEHRKLVRPLVFAHNGKEVKTIGDAFLVEFGSAVEATRCALEIQGTVKGFDADRRAQERIELRIGIHLGDVVHSENDVYGDAVNIASRIEGLAEPGGVAISRQVYESVRSKLPWVKFESLGARKMRNVKSDIEVFALRKDLDAPSQGKSQPRNRIGVLPFVNISSDPSDEYFADGLTEELISCLSQARDLRVIARTSAMNYKNATGKNVREIGRELGAGTVIEGSVRKAGSRIRVTVQAINAVSEEHLWSSSYDRNLDDIFAIQTDIATKVAESVSSSLAPRRELRAPDGMEDLHGTMAYNYFLHGRHLLHGETESSVKQAFEFFSRAIGEDPSFARAYVGRAQCNLALNNFGHLPFAEGARKAEIDLDKALELDPDLAEAYAALAHAKYDLDEFGAAEKAALRAIELKPSLSDAYAALGRLKWIRGKAEETLELYETAYRLDPLNDELVGALAEVYITQGRSEEALRLLRSVEQIFPQISYAARVLYDVSEHDCAKAEEFAQKFRGVSESESMFVLGVDGAVAACRGDKEEALAIVKQIEKSSGKDSIAVNIVGEIYHMLGDLDNFFEYMKRSADSHALPMGTIINAPSHKDVRKDPRTKDLLARFDLKLDFLSENSS